MKKIPFLSLQLRLLLPVLIVIIPGTILSINTLIGERQHLKTDILDLTFRTAQIISVQEEGLIEATRELLITISHEPFLQKGKLHDNQQFLSSLLNQLGRYTNIEIADTTGNIISSAIPFALHTTIADRVYFRNIMKNGNFAIREYQVDRIIGQPAINFAYPIVNEIGEKTGIVLAVLDLKKLKNLEEKIVFKLPEGCILTKIDRNGIILFQYPNKHDGKGNSFFSNFSQFTYKISQGHRTAWITNANGIRYLNTFSQIKSSLFPTGISLILTIPEEFAFREIYHTFLRNLFFLSMLGLIILLLTAIANELLIVRGLYTLQNAALQIRDGNLKARVESIRGFIEVKELTRIFNEMADNIEQQAMHRTQIEEELQFRNTILTAQQESSIDGIMVVDEDYNIVLYNHRLMDMWEVPSDLIARKANEPTLFVANKVADSLIFIQRVQYLYQHKEEISQEEILLKDGRVFERYTTPMIGPGDKYYGRIWYFHDITERKHAEFEIARINRALRMLSSTNQALIRTTNETELLNEACRIIVEIGGYQLAWVGFAEDDKAGTLRPVSYTGFYSGDYGPEGISRADNERGQNPEDITIRTGQPYLAHNIPVDLLFYTWKDAAIHQDFKSVIALPLICEGQTLGSLGIYSNQTDEFNASEIEILKEMAADMAFGINAMHIKYMKNQAELALRDSEALRSMAFHSSPLASAIIRAHDECIIDANEIVLKYWGLTRNELIGRTNQELRFFMNPVDHDMILRKLHEEGFVKSYEFTARNRDDKILFLSLSASVFNLKNEEHYLTVYVDITEQKKAEKSLQDSEKKYRIVADNTYNWEFWTDSDINYIYCSPSCFRVTGYTANEFIENPELKFEIVHPDYRSLFYHHVYQNSIDETTKNLEFKIIHKDGSERWLEHVCQPIFDTEGNYLGIRGSNFDITEKKEMDRKILNTIISTEESERNKFSRELHDGLGPMLSIVKLCFQWIAETPDAEQMRIIIEMGLRNIDEAIQQVRDISNVLSPRILSNMGLISAINHAINLVNATKKLLINFTYDHERRYNSQIEITLYRIVIELINNTIKHAKANNVEINLSSYSNKNCVKLTYSDDGIGFNFDQAIENNKGLGLHNMMQRVATLQGFINFDTDEGKPLIVIIELPLINEDKHEQN